MRNEEESRDDNILPFFPPKYPIVAAELTSHASLIIARGLRGENIIIVRPRMIIKTQFFVQAAQKKNILQPVVITYYASLPSRKGEKKIRQQKKKYIPSNDDKRC